MAAPIDEKIVSMQLDNENFEKNAKQSINTFSDLNNKMANPNTGGLLKIQNGVESIANKFTLLGSITRNFYDTIANKVVSTAFSSLDALLFRGARGGYGEYEQKMNSIQTVIANTGESTKDVNKALNELNLYADKTVYSFADMTRNIGLFTAAGVNLKDSVLAIKGLSNMAATMGVNNEQASRATFQLSQALAAGVVNLQDWRSVINAGLSGAKFQKALMDTGNAMGTLSIKFEDMKKKGTNFRTLMESKGKEGGWLTSAVLLETLRKFATGWEDVQAAKEKALQTGSKKDMDEYKLLKKYYEEYGKSAYEAATKVKTFTQLKDTIFEGIGSNWAQIWETIVGDIDEAKTLWTGVAQAIAVPIDEIGKKTVDVLQKWKEMGGRTQFFDAIGKTFSNIGKIIGAFAKPFAELFPKDMSKNLSSFSSGFLKLANAMEPSKELLDGISSISGFFVKQIKSIISAVNEFVGSIFPKKSGKSKTVLDGPKQQVEEIAKAVKDPNMSGKSLTEKMSKLANVLFTGIVNAFKILWDNKSVLLFIIVIKQVNKIKKKILDLLNPIKKIHDAIDTIKDTFSSGKKGVDKMKFVAYATFIASVGYLISQVVSLSQADIQGAINGIAAISIFMMLIILGLRNISQKTFSGVQVGAIISAISSYVKSFATVTKTLSTIKEEQILFIGLVLTAMLFVLSQFISRMAELSAMGMRGGSLLAAGASIIGISIGITILSAAFKLLSTIKYKDIGKGLLAMAGMLGVYAAFTRIVSTNILKILAAAIAFDIMAVGIAALGIALLPFKLLTFDDVYKMLIGLGGVVVGLSILSFSMKKVRSMAGFLLLSVSLIAIAKAIKTFNNIKPESALVGVLALSSMIIILSGVALLLNRFGKFKITSVLAQFIGMGILISVLTDSLLRLVGVPILPLVQVATTLVVSFVAMSLTIGLLKFRPGSLVATLGISNLLNSMVKAFMLLSALNVKKLAADAIILVGSFVILAAAMASIPTGIGKGIALITYSAALFIFAKALSSISQLDITSIVIGIGAMAAALLLLVGMAALVNKFSIGITKITTLMISFGIMALLVTNAIQTIIAALGVLHDKVTSGAEKAAEAQKKIEEGTKITISGVVNGIKAAIGEILRAAVDIVIAIAAAIAENAWRLVQAASVLILSLIDGLAQGLRKYGGLLINVLGSLFESLLEMLLNLITGLIKKFLGWIPGVKGAIEKLEAGAKEGLNKLFDVDETTKKIDEEKKKLTDSIGKFGDAAKDKAKSVGNDISSGLKESLGGSLNEIINDKNVKDITKQLEKNGIDTSKIKLDTKSNKSLQKQLEEQKVLQKESDNTTKKAQQTTAEAKKAAEEAKKKAEQIKKEEAKWNRKFDKKELHVGEDAKEYLEKTAGKDGDFQSILSIVEDKIYSMGIDPKHLTDEGRMMIEFLSRGIKEGTFTLDEVPDLLYDKLTTDKNLYTEAGKNISDKVGEGFFDNTSALDKDIDKKTKEKFTQITEELGAGIKESIDDGTNALVNEFVGATDDPAISTYADTRINKVREKLFKGLFDKDENRPGGLDPYSIGFGIVDGIGNGMAAAQDQAAAKAAEAAEKLIKAMFKGLDGDEDIGGGDPYDVGTNFADALAQGLDAHAENVKTSAKNLKKDLFDGVVNGDMAIGDSPGGLFEAGLDYAIEFGDGVLAGKDVVEKDSNIIVEEAEHSFSSGSLNMPSKGYETSSKFAQGISSGSSIAINRATSVSYSAARAFGSSGAFDIAWEGGKYITSGLAQGIGSAGVLSSAISKAKSIGKKVANAALVGADVHSPSKITTYGGEMIGQGLIVGLQNKESSITNFGERIGFKTASVINDSIDLIKDLIERDDVYSPTIKPVVDLDNLHTLQDYITSLAIDTKLLDPMNTNKIQNGSSNNINVTVNIDASKATNLQDIAKMTKNQIESTIKKEVRNIKWA